MKMLTYEYAQMVYPTFVAVVFVEGYHPNLILYG
jgi:hypothetical protein